MPAGRPPGSTKNPETELLKAQNAWTDALAEDLRALNKSRTILYKRLDEPGLSAAAAAEIASVIRDNATVAAKIVEQLQKVRDKNPEIQAGSDPEDTSFLK